MGKVATRLKVIHSLDEIPEFASESEEANFWDTHSMSGELWDSLPEDDGGLPPAGTPMGVNLSLSPDLAHRLRKLARKKGLNYVELARSFVSERLYEEEKREGIIGETRAS